MNEGMSLLLMIVVVCIAFFGFFFFVSSPTQPFHLNPNQTIISIGNGWERVVINKTDVVSFKNLTKNSIVFVFSCKLYLFNSNDNLISDSGNVSGNVTSIIEFPNTVYSTSPVGCFSAIWGGEEETLNINGNDAHYIIERYNGEYGANLVLK